ncbi:MAG: class I SAM-dependent methyltransferase [Burkholderiales bacterium]
MNKSEQNGTSENPVLIFPSGAPRSLEYLQKCRRDGQAVIGASSLSHDVSREEYPAWFHLPYVTDPQFDDALTKAIATFGIVGIFSPNPVVWDHLSRELARLAPGVLLVNESPINVELSGYRAARDQARSWLAAPLPVATAMVVKPSMSEIELAALFRHAVLIPGMCDHEKIFALNEIARRSTAGDIVEIGSWWGKSAFVLARLAICYDIGNLLCVDPWSNHHLAQHDGKSVVDRVSAQVDAEEALKIFEINLLPYSEKHVNYLRMPSEDAVQHYREHLSATTTSFGTTKYRGRIAILHIDGNHSYAAAKSDVASWSGFVADGGWIIVDDYIWPYGDGPKRAGDEFLAEHRERISVAFVMGSALFIQLSSRLAQAGQPLLDG